MGQGWGWTVVLAATLSCAPGSDDDDVLDEDAGASDDATGEPAVSPYDGAPLTVMADGGWHWVDIEGMACADGRQSGVGVRRVDGSRKLALYFKGGGACFNESTCGLTAPLMLTGVPALESNAQGILDLDNEASPLHDYNVVYFPYCTGDIHSGTVAQGQPEGVEEPWDFVGAANVLAALDRVAPTFADIDSLAVIGTSAGGLGALANYPRIAEGWPDTPTVVLDDSGLVFRDAYLRPCLQRQLREAWGLADSLPPCEDCNGADGGGLAALYPWLATEYPDTRFGLIGATRDEIIRIFYGFGNDDCGSSLGLPDLGAETLTEALLDLEGEVLSGHFATYLIDGETHTWTTKPLFFTTQSQGVVLRDWVADLLEGDVPDVGP